MLKVIRKIIPILLILNFTVGCKEVDLPEQRNNQEKMTTKANIKHDFSEIRTSTYHSEKAKGNDNMFIDTSSVNEGYVAVSAISNNKLKFQVVKENEIYNYDINNNGEPSIIPLQCGDGTYIFQIMENLYGKKYGEKYKLSEEVKLKNEFEPFLHPNDYIQFNKDSECVKMAAEITENTMTDTEAVNNIYKYICNNIKYDTKKAETIKKIYKPNLDTVLFEKKGICFDYAALAAGMLRSQGIPTKLVMGYLEPDNLYHAWNMVYTKENGWVLIDFTDKTTGNTLLTENKKIYKELYEY